MLKLIFSYFSVLGVIIFQFSSLVYATPANHPVINEIQTNGLGTGTAGEEFIEIYNPTSSTVSIEDWYVRYVSSTGSLLTAKSIFTFPTGTNLYPLGSIVVLPQTYIVDLDSMFRYSLGSFSGLSSDGATLDLIDRDGNLIDRVGWGTKPTILSEAVAAILPAKGESIQRKLDDGLIVDSDNNSLDFEIKQLPTPLVLNLAPLPPTDPVVSPSNEDPTTSPNTEPELSDPVTLPETNQEDLTQPTETQSQPEETLLPLQLTELMIDPLAPLSDAYDEWVEIYNPNSVAVSLNGYSVAAGLTGSYKYTFTNQTIEPNAYITISSKETPITLSNSSSKVVLSNPQNAIVDEVSYENAVTGSSYAKDINGNWHWTTTPTPLAINKIISPISPALVAAATVKKATKSKSTSTKAASTKKAAAKKTPASKAVKKAKTTAVKGSNSNFDSKPLTSAPSPIPNNLLAIVAILAILYGCYEYRFEIKNKFRQFQLYRESRSKIR